MSKYFNFKSIAFFFSFIFFMSSCGSDDKKNDETTNSPASTATATSSNTVTVPTGSFYNLYIDRRAFDTLQAPNKIIFCHTFAADDKVHLDGWVLRGSGFNTPPNMPLKNGTPSTTVNYGAGTYFGNVVLQFAGFKSIKDALLDQTMQFVLFKPKKIDNYHIGYDITVSSSSSFTTEANFKAIAEANPSPPRGY